MGQPRGATSALIPSLTALVTTRGGPRAALIIMAAAGALMQWTQPIGHDVAWLMEAAERWLDGAQLYDTDVIETNPHLIVYSFSVPIAFARRSGLDEIRPDPPRFPALWVLPALMRARDGQPVPDGLTPERLGELERWLRRAVTLRTLPTRKTPSMRPLHASGLPPANRPAPLWYIPRARRTRIGAAVHRCVGTSADRHIGTSAHRSAPSATSSVAPRTLEKPGDMASSIGGVPEPTSRGRWAAIGTRWRISPVECLVMIAGLWLHHRYFWLLDDAFVYFRYVDNLVLLDAGLVFNRGEYVEGFTSPLWLLPLATLRTLGLDHLTSVYLVGVISLIAFQWTLLAINRALSPDGAPAVNLPLILLGVNYGVLCYFSSGLETPWVQLIAASTALYILRPSSIWLEAFVAQMALLRPDLAIALVSLVLWRWIDARRPPWRLIALAAGPGLAWLLFRIYYYADVFPNTFYLKNESWPSQGLLYLHDTLWPYGAYFIAPATIAGFLWLRRAGAQGNTLHGRERMAMCVIAILATVYVVRVGGDTRHYRYLAFAFCLASCATGGLIEHAMRRWSMPHRGRLATVVSGLLALASFAAYPRQLEAHPAIWPERGGWAGKITDAAWHRHWPLIADYAEWRGEVSADALRRWRRDWEYVEVSSRGPCVQFYRDMDRFAVQLAGLTNAFVARTQGLLLSPGHNLYSREWFEELRAVYRAGPIGRGMFDAARARPDAPAWIEENRETLAIIEAKVFNRHDFFENLELATRFPPRMTPMQGQSP